MSPRRGAEHTQDKAVEALGSATTARHTCQATYRRSHRPGSHHWLFCSLETKHHKSPPDRWAAAADSRGAVAKTSHCLLHELPSLMLVTAR